MLPLRLISLISRFWKHTCEELPSMFAPVCPCPTDKRFLKSLGMLISAYLHRKLGGIPCLAEEMPIGDHKAAFQPQADCRPLDCRPLYVQPDNRSQI